MIDTNEVRAKAHELEPYPTGSLLLQCAHEIDRLREDARMLRLALGTTDAAATLYANQVAHWIEKHDRLRSDLKDMEEGRDDCDKALKVMDEENARLRAQCEHRDRDLAECAEQRLEARADVERLLAIGVGYSQQTVDALTAERDTLRKLVWEANAGIRLVDQYRHCLMNGWLERAEKTLEKP